MKRWLPSPLLSVGLLLMWLLLNQTLEPGHWLLGGLLGIVAPLLARPLQPHGYAQLRRPLALLRLMGFSIVEIVRSCFNVSQIIMLRRSANVNSQFIRVPLDLFGVQTRSSIGTVIRPTQRDGGQRLAVDNPLWEVTRDGREDALRRGAGWFTR